MKTATLFAAIGALALPLAAQIDVTVATANNGGIALNPKTGSSALQNWGHPKTFSGYSNYLYQKMQNGSNTWSYDYARTYVTPPYKSSYYNTVYNNVSVYNYAYIRPGTSVATAGTTKDSKGTAGAQSYTITIKRSKSIPMMVDLRINGSIYGNSVAKISLTGNGVNKSWSWTKIGYSYTTDQVVIAKGSGTVTLTLTIDAQCKPGGSNSGKYYDGYYAGLYMSVLDGTPGSFTLTNNIGCTKQYKLAGVGQPVKGSYYTVEMSGMTKGQACSMLTSYNDKTLRGFLTLPIPLDYMGANGCKLAVDIWYPWARFADANGKASAKMYLSAYWKRDFFVQGLVFDAKANKAGFVLTEKGTLKY
jgi:hypothetical protein